MPARAHHVTMHSIRYPLAHPISRNVVGRIASTSRLRAYSNDGVAAAAGLRPRRVGGEVARRDKPGDAPVPIGLVDRAGFERGVDVGEQVCRAVLRELDR